MVDISLIIVNWNTRDLLLNCISSIIDQTKRHSYEIIVVDNASADGSQEAVLANFPGVRLIRNQDNLGFAKANNIGFAAASGRYVTLVNSDILILDGCLDRMCDYMDKNTDIGLLGPMTVNERKQIRYNVRNSPTLWNTACEAFGLDKVFPDWSPFRGRLRKTGFGKRTVDVEVLSGCLLMARAKAMSEVGILDERFFIYGEDKDWCKRYRDQGWRVVFNPEAVAIHYGGASSAVAPVRYLIEKLKSDFTYWHIHHGRFQGVAYSVLKLAHYSLRLALLGVAGWGIANRAKTENLRKKMEGHRACLNWILANQFSPRSRGVASHVR